MGMSWSSVAGGEEGWPERKAVLRDGVIEGWIRLWRWGGGAGAESGERGIGREGGAGRAEDERGDEGEEGGDVGGSGREGGSMGECDEERACVAGGRGVRGLCVAGGGGRWRRAGARGVGGGGRDGREMRDRDCGRWVGVVVERWRRVDREGGGDEGGAEDGRRRGVAREEGGGGGDGEGGRICEECLEGRRLGGGEWDGGAEGGWGVVVEGSRWREAAGGRMMVREGRESWSGGGQERERTGVGRGEEGGEEMNGIFESEKSMERAGEQRGEEERERRGGRDERERVETKKSLHFIT
ncbi:hypothetical protein Tco_0467478 [Tanacetum coccineum]